jgi:hypothetical protein
MPCAGLVLPDALVAMRDRRDILPSPRHVNMPIARPVWQGESFINTGPSDMNDRTKPDSVSWVPAETDIHGWSRFVVGHRACWSQERRIEDLVRLVDDSHRLLRAQGGR